MPRYKNYNPDEILRKAMHVFWERGYYSTSMRILEKELGINQFSIYAEFKDKEELFMESLKEYRQYARNTIYKPLFKEGTRIAELEHFLNDYVESSVNEEKYRGCLVVNSTAVFNMDHPGIKKELVRYYDFIKSMLKGILLNSVQAGDIPPETDIDERSNYLLGLMQGLSVGVRILPLKQLTDTVKVAFIAIYK
ncbi:MAG: TetR/AcrR family transcriptional regulator [Bacteroidales bacterium]|nr:TetR/AcrR family transcriptional regulator [Bacteroidales bacterium]